MSNPFNQIFATPQYPAIILFGNVFWFQTISFMLHIVTFNNDRNLHSFFRRRWKKTSLVVTGLCEVEFTGDRWIPQTQRVSKVEIYLFDDVIMNIIFDSDFTVVKICNWVVHLTGSGNGMTMNRQQIDHKPNQLGPLLLTWFNFNPSMDK